MVAAIDVRATQARTLGAVEAEPDIRTTQARVLAAVRYPALDVRTTQVRVLNSVTANLDIRTTQARVLAAVKGRTVNPKILAWPFSLDGHDIYVIRLGETTTLEFDLTTGQWAEWNGHGLSYLRVRNGQNWLGMGKTTALRAFGTNIVAGDDRDGILWMLDPTVGIDDGSTTGTQAYTRSVTGLVPQRMRQTTPVGGVYVVLSLGQPSVVGAAITLRYSDNWGKTFVTAGTITVENGNYQQEIAFRSLGLIRAPGRIFELSDDGAAVRIGSCKMR